jgi:glc operon protein GlcG
MPAEVGVSLLVARRVVDAAVAEARRLGAPGAAIAVVDGGGYPLALEKLDGTFVTAGTIALGKARTAAIFGRPTKALENAINGGRASMLAIVATAGATPMQGGVPLSVGGRVVGGVGVAGAASADQDSEIAEAAARAVADPAALGAATLAHFSARQVVASFEAGKPLVENAGFKVHASRRVNAGEAEVHLLDTDIFYVLEGEATLVLGGAVTEARHTTPTEVRGKGIEGGEIHPLKKGDVLVVPAGTPHWFKEVVAGPVLYYTVKSTGAAR